MDVLQRHNALSAIIAFYHIPEGCSRGETVNKMACHAEIQASLYNVSVYHPGFSMLQ